MSYRQLLHEFGPPAASIVSSGIVYWSGGSSQKYITGKIETSEKRIQHTIHRTEQSLHKKISETEQTLNQKIEQTKQELAKGVKQGQEIATGAPLIILDDPKKLPIMHERLKAFSPV